MTHKISQYQSPFKQHCPYLLSVIVEEKDFPFSTTAQTDTDANLKKRTTDNSFL